MQDEHLSVLLLSNATDNFQKKIKTSTNLFPTFYQNQDLVSWIWGLKYIKMLVRYFSNNPDICGYVGKLEEVDPIENRPSTD